MPLRSALAIDGGTPVRADRLPLHKPWFDGASRPRWPTCWTSTHVAGDGVKGRELERLLRESTGARGVLALNSCTAALEIAVQVAGLGPGDEVILPSFTFVSTANAVIKAGARPVFADIDPMTLGLDPRDVARRVTPRTRAILPMHYAGMSCDMAALEAIAAAHRLVADRGRRARRQRDLRRAGARRGRRARRVLVSRNQGSGVR